MPDNIRHVVLKQFHYGVFRGDLKLLCNTLLPSSEREPAKRVLIMFITKGTNICLNKLYLYFDTRRGLASESLYLIRYFSLQCSSPHKTAHNFIYWSADQMAWNYIYKKKIKKTKNDRLSEKETSNKQISIIDVQYLRHKSSNTSTQYAFVLCMKT